MDKHNRRYESQKKLNEQRDFENQQELFLNLKRKKLSNLLNSEELNYRNEIISGQETSEDVKRRIDIFLSTEFEGGRHQTRVDLIKDIENK